MEYVGTEVYRFIYYVYQLFMNHTFIIETILPVPAWCGLHFSKENNAQVFAEYGNYLTPFVRSGPHVSFPTFASAYQCDILSFFNTHQSNPELWECLKCPEGTSQ